MKREPKASQRRLETKGERGLQIREIRLQIRVKKDESTVQKMAEKDDGKGCKKWKKEAKEGCPKG